MKNLYLFKVALFISLLSFNGLSYGAALQFYELATPIIATAAVGQAAIANVFQASLNVMF